MSMLLQVALLEKYGPRLTVTDLSQVLHMAAGTIRNRISNGTLKLPTYLDGGARFADYRDVAAYLDECRSATRAEDSCIA